MQSPFFLIFILVIIITATFSQSKERGDSFSYFEAYQRLDQIYQAAEEFWHFRPRRKT
jgi:hypothetical protein